MTESPMNMPPNEHAPTELQNIIALQEARQTAAERTAAGKLQAFFDNVRVEGRTAPISRTKRDGLPYDEPFITLATIMSLQTAGVDTRLLLDESARPGLEGEALAAIELQGERLAIRRYDRGFSYSLQSTGSSSLLEGQPSKALHTT